MVCNVFANALSAFISDPVDAVTGTYTINTTDFILASLPTALRLERTYSSTSGKSSCMGSGWSFNYGSRIYRDTGHTRVHLAAGLAAQAMKTIGPQRQVILLCDSWYPKAEVAALVEQFENLEMVCNARVDTALYGLAPARTGKRGRPRKRGDRISLDEITLNEPQNGDWLIGIMPVITNLWKDKVVYALVTAPKNGKGSRRLFLCTTDPGSICFDWENSADKTACFYGAENIFYLPLAWYGLRWNIEVSYYEGKTFWSMEEYRIRSKEGIERMVNLISLSYSAMTLLPYSDETFSGYQSASAQETRYEIGQQIQADIILCSFGKFLETFKNCSILIKVVEDYILSGFRKFQKL